MLDTLRNSARGAAGKIIVGLIAITFVLFGAESIISIVGSSAPATVNGEDISEIDLQRVLSNRQQELTEQFGADFALQFVNSPYFQQEAMELLVGQTLQLQLASQLGLDASEAQVLADITETPVFQTDGQFDQDRYLSLLSANGYNHQGFVLRRSKDIALSQLRAGIADSAFVLDKTIQRYADLNAQTRAIQYRRFAAADFAQQIDLSEEELDQYYRDNQNLFVSDEQVRVNYVLLTLASIAEQQIVTEAEVQAAYDSYRVSLAAEDSREVSHILFSDGDPSAEAAAALARLEAGESFADLAAELSDDPGSATAGGYLGELIPDIYVQEFYDAAIALTEEGEFSPPISTQFGIHLIRLDSISTIEPVSIEELRAELTSDISERKARNELLVVEAELSDLAFSTDDISELAEAFQTDVLSSEWLTRSNNEEPFASAAATSAAFSSEVIDGNLLSEVIRLTNDDLLVLQKQDYQPSQVEPFVAVSEAVTQMLTQERSQQLMAEQVESLLQEQQIDGDGWVRVEALARGDSEVPSQVVAEAFAMPVGNDGPSLARVEAGADTLYLVALLAVNDGEIGEEQLQQAEAFSAQQAPEADFQLFYNRARGDADITIRR